MEQALNTQSKKYATNTTTARHCWDCDQYYPPTTDYFYRDRNRQSGLKSSCKECTKRRANKWNHQNKPKRAGQARKTYDLYYRSTGAIARNRADRADNASREIREAA